MLGIASGCLFVGEDRDDSEEVFACLLVKTIGGDIEEEGLGNNGGIISSAPTAILSAPPSTIQPSFQRVS